MTRARVGLASLALLCGLPAAVHPSRAVVTLTVSVDGFENAEGAAGIAVWNGAQGFPEGIEHAVATTYVTIEDGRASTRFDDLAPGTWAVTVYHDRNDNKRFDKNWMGMPKEAWGVSNNIRPRLRAPRFDEARLELEAGEHVVPIGVD